MKCYTYMVRCNDNSLYTGWTTNLQARIKEHNEGESGAKYTRARRPVRLVYHEEFDTKSAAMKRECEIKRLSKKKKENLVKNHLHKSL